VERAEVIREKGTDRSKFIRGEVQKYQWVDDGSSYLLAESLAAILLGQLESIEEIQKRRQNLFSTYEAALASWSKKFDFELQTSHAFEKNIAHMFYLIANSKTTRDKVITRLLDSGIQAMFHYQSLASSKKGRMYKSGRDEFEVSERMSNRLFRLPLFFDLSDKSQERIIECVTNSM
jgi:dTDP-4-amino-4,6-dideoxygalactose transaminase